MKLKKILNVIKKNHKADIMNVGGGVLFSNGESLYMCRDMPAIYSSEEFGVIFEIDEDKLSAFTVNIDSAEEVRNAFMSIGSGIPLERGGSFSYGGLRCILFKKADARQITIEETVRNAETDLSGYIAIDPEELSPIRDGIISFEYISFLGEGAVCAYENGSPVAVIKPLSVTDENIGFIRKICEGLSKYYKAEQYSGGY